MKMSLKSSALSGLIGACALNLLHESARRIVPNAPRMDLLGMQALAKSLRKADVTPPSEDELRAWTLVGDIAANSLYYGLVGVGKPEGALLRGTLLGLAAGVGGVLLPKPLGLGTAPSARTNVTKAMTVGWYLVGGIVAAMTYGILARKENDPS
jgi:hypothetical protein